MKNSLIITCCICLLMSLSVNNYAQNSEKEFDKILTELFADDGPGGTAIIVKKGATIYKKAFGKANLELDVPMQTNHIFRIGSITKQFTACAILKLAEEGKLSLEDDLTKYVIDYPTHGHAITIEHLLTHTSGIKSYTDLEKWDAEAHKRDFTPEEMVDYFKNEPMDFAPGEEFRYNNSAYFLLGYIIEKVSGKTYAEYINDAFFQPLGMTNSSYGSLSRIVKNRAAGYQKGENYENAAVLSMTQPYAAGSLLSNVDDLSKWYHAVNSGKVINKASMQKAHTNYQLNDGKPAPYGYGWFLGNIQGSPMYQHGGGIHGYLTASLFLPKEEVFVAVFSNCTCNAPGQTAFKLAATAIGKSFDRKKIKISKGEIAKYQAVYESENDGENQIVITAEDGKLFAFPTGGSKSEIFPFAKDQFFAEGRLETLAFERDANGMISGVVLNTTYSPTSYKRTNKALPKIEAISVDAALLEKYVGKYQLAPEFIITIMKEGDQLIAQATGQPKLNIIPISEHKFALKDVDAQLLFHFDDTGKTTGLTLFQGGEHEAKRID